HQVESSDADVRAAARIARLPGLEVRREVNRERNGEGLQHWPWHHDARRHGQMIQLVLFAIDYRPPECCRLHDDICVGEQNIFTAGLCLSGVQRVILAELSSGQFVHVDDTQPWAFGGEAIEYRSGGIGRAVVDRDNFEV